MSANVLGHCHPEVVAAVQAAAESVNVGDMVGYPPREQATDDLLDIAYQDEDWAGSVAFFVSSSEACDLGLSLAQMLTGRDPLVCRRSGYHGGVGLAREVSHHPMWDTSLSSLAGGVQPRPRLAETREIPIPECGRAFQPDGHDCSETCLAGAPEALDGAAAVIMDYSQGGVVPSAQYQDGLAGMAKDAGALWVADETVTCYGRMGHWFAFQRGSTRPDIVTMGKGITAGAVPAGALILSKDVVDAIGDRRWMTSSTYRGHPLAVAVMSTVIKVIERDGLIERASRLGAGLGNDLGAIAASHPCVQGLIGEGMSWLIQMTEPDRSLDEDKWMGDGQHSPISTAVHKAVLDQGVLIPEFSGERLWIVPPLIISEDDLALALEALDQALAIGDRMLEAAGAIS
jgi:4-aminobutyrate aminotransferase-like enzyme